jgi:hypothetical protein
MASRRIPENDAVFIRIRRDVLNLPCVLLQPREAGRGCVFSGLLFLQAANETNRHSIAEQPIQAQRKIKPRVH